MSVKAIEVWPSGTMPTLTVTLLFCVYCPTPINTEYGLHVWSICWSLWSSRSITGVRWVCIKKEWHQCSNAELRVFFMVLSWLSFCCDCIPVSTMMHRLCYWLPDSLMQSAVHTTASYWHKMSLQCCWRCCQNRVKAFVLHSSCRWHRIPHTERDDFSQKCDCSAVVWMKMAPHRLMGSSIIWRIRACGSGLWRFGLRILVLLRFLRAILVVDCHYSSVSWDLSVWGSYLIRGSGETLVLVLGHLLKHLSSFWTQDLACVWVLIE